MGENPNFWKWRSSEFDVNVCHNRRLHDNVFAAVTKNSHTPHSLWCVRRLKKPCIIGGSI